MHYRTRLELAKCLHGRNSSLCLLLDLIIIGDTGIALNPIYTKTEMFLDLASRFRRDVFNEAALLKKKAPSSLKKPPARIRVNKLDKQTNPSNLNHVGWQTCCCC